MLSKTFLCSAIITFVIIKGITGVVIGNLPTLQHEVSGSFQILNSKTIRIDNFNYDGLGPDSWFYYFPPGVSANRNGDGGEFIPLPSEFGESNGRLKDSRYTDVTVQVTMPDGTDTCDIGTFIIWCRPFRAIFTQLAIPRDIFENNGDDPCTVKQSAVVVPLPVQFDNCIPFDEQLQLSWRVHESSVHFRLCGCQSMQMSTNQYMGFGLSGSSSATQMAGADATVTWVDEKEGPQAVDYYLSQYTQCRAGEGACPDELYSSGTCTNDVYEVEGSVSNGVQCVSFFKNFSTADSTCDQTINPDNSNQYIVWAIGGLGETAFRHFLNANSNSQPIHLNRTPNNECEDSGLVCSGCDPFENKEMIERRDTTFLVRVGPSGNERGYQGITGRAGWGIAFYVNGTLIPELVVERGRTYTFLIEGGKDPAVLANYHPLYITDSIGGGRLENTQAEKDAETVYAGFNDNDQPTAVGDLCELRETDSSENTRESCNTLEAYIATLETSGDCASAQPGKLVWTPDDNTPDTVYYQCATHLNLGWKITVLDQGERYDGSSSGPRVAAVTLLVLVLALITFIFM